MTDSSRPHAQGVLVVDDNRDMADNVAELFSGIGYRCRVAHCGNEARAVANETDFDLAIVDLRLPGESGVEVAASLRQARPHAEIILMTANASLDTAIAAVREGAYAYVQKPFDPDELLSLGGHALAQVELRRERTRLEQRLGQSEALYRGVVDTVDSLIVGLDAAGMIRMWSHSAARATERDAHELHGRPFADLLVSKRARSRLAEALLEVERGRVVSDLELALTTSAGAQRLVRWNLRRFADSAGGAPLVLAVGEDLTDRTDLERRAAEAEAMASLGTLTAGLAHEIRNPLNAASLQLELLRRSADKLQDVPTRERIETRVGIVRQELARLTNLLDDFLQLAKPKGLSLAPVDLCAVVQEVLELQEPAATKAGVSIRTRCDSRDIRVMADRPLLKQVLVNLVINSLDALRSAGTGQIVVHCQEASESRVELSVEDDGPGVPDEVAGRLFSPFVSSKEAGTGLGLTIVKRIVDRHGGSISISSAPGRGTRVRISLERAQR